MSMEQKWMSEARLFRLPDNQDTRLAFQGGARFIMSALVDHINDPDTMADAMEKLNDEMVVFGMQAMAMEKAE